MLDTYTACDKQTGEYGEKQVIRLKSGWHLSLINSHHLYVKMKWSLSVWIHDYMLAGYHYLAYI